MNSTEITRTASRTAASSRRARTLERTKPGIRPSSACASAAHVTPGVIGSRPAGAGECARAAAATGEPEITVAAFAAGQFAAQPQQRRVGFPQLFQAFLSQ